MFLIMALVLCIRGDRNTLISVNLRTLSDDRNYLHKRSRFLLRCDRDRIVRDRLKKIPLPDGVVEGINNSSET